MAYDEKSAGIPTPTSAEVQQPELPMNGAETPQGNGGGYPHPKYVPDDQQMQLINNNFVYHAPKGDQQERYVRLREEFRRLAILIVENTPKTRESALSITQLEQAMFWANAAIARNE